MIKTKSGPTAYQPIHRCLPRRLEKEPEPLQNMPDATGGLFILGVCAASASGRTVRIGFSVGATNIPEQAFWSGLAAPGTARHWMGPRRLHLGVVRKVSALLHFNWQTCQKSMPRNAQHPPHVAATTAG